MLSRVSVWPTSQAHYRATPQSWSSLEVFDHLLKTESAIVHAASTNLARGGTLERGDTMRRLMVMWAMRFPTRLKVPKETRQVLPSPRQSLAAIADEWSAARIELRKLLEALDPEQLRWTVFQHPVGGWMRIREMLQFFSAHQRHHEYQLMRIARDFRRSPAAGAKQR